MKAEKAVALMIVWIMFCVLAFAGLVIALFIGRILLMQFLLGVAMIAVAVLIGELGIMLAGLIEVMMKR